MSILLTDEQEAISREARRVLDARFDKARLLDLLLLSGEYDQTFWHTACEQGWAGMAIPEAFGGLGLGLTELGLVAEAAGRVSAGVPFLSTNDGAATALLDGAHDGVKAQWLPRLAAGEALGAVAFSEGNDVLPHAPAVTFDGDVLSGTKNGVAAGRFAHFAVVLASRAGEPVLVVADLNSVTRRTIQSYDNSRGYADLMFAATPAVLLAEGDTARATARNVLARMAVVIAHEQVGGAEWLMLAARDYAITRKAFGQPIGAFQSVKHRIAELYALVEIGRANCQLAAAQSGQPGFPAAAASARISATEAYDAAARDCVQVHGGIGVTWESGLHLHMRRARSLAAEVGNLFFWEDLLVDELSKGVAA